MFYIIAVSCHSVLNNKIFSPVILMTQTIHLTSWNVRSGVWQWRIVKLRKVGDHYTGAEESRVNLPTICFKHIVYFYDMDSCESSILCLPTVKSGG